MKKAGWGVTALLLFLLWSGAVPSAAAHAGNTGFSTLKVEDHSIRYDLFLTEMSLLPYDSSQDGKVTKEELETGHIGDYLSRRLSLSNEGSP
ncbi:hypothetical protein N6H14_16530 [Paenibacillus sp. CC-CFT747]|nr:hypothetical protein N6H14_16530 [Paenibacillus sp. CC-CFT747]